jgi:predicted transcriptional regulator
MRTRVDLPEADVRPLDRIAARRLVSRAELIRQAVSEFVARGVAGEAGAAFGLWRDRGIEALEYQRRLREEW